MVIHITPDKAPIEQLSQEPVASPEASAPKKSNRVKKIVGGAVLAVTAIGTTAAVLSHHDSEKRAKVSADATPNRYNPGATNALSSPSSIETPSSSYSLSVADANKSKQLEAFIPLRSDVMPDQPYGSEVVFKRLYNNLQVADQTGDPEGRLLEATVGTRNITGTLAKGLRHDISRFQDYWQTFPEQRLDYEYMVESATQSEPNSYTWDVIVKQQQGKEIIRMLQKVTLGQELNEEGGQSWIIQSIHDTQPVE